MADLLARFKLVDEMSDKLGRMAESGQDMAAQFEQAGAAANAAFDNISGGVSSAVSSVDGVATSIDSLQSSVDNWTSAVGNYDRSALEAIYSTEELVEMGLKSADALEEQQRMFELCEQSAQALGKSMDATADIQEGLSNAIEQSDKAIKSVTNNEKVSAEAKANLAEAAEKAAEAMNELEQAQQEADAAMEAYDRTMASGTTDLNQLEAAAERAGHAAEALAEANGKASDATEELSKATEQANEEAEQGGKSGKEAIEGIASALAAAGITATLKEISGAVYELADYFSEAEKIIVGATGATGQELDNLMASATNVFANSNAESLNEVAAGMTSVQRATGLTGEALEEATNAGLVLNNVLGYEVSESSRTASALMKNFGLSAEEAYNLIVIGAQQGADRNGDLLDVLNEYAPQYAALGLSAQEFLSSLVDGADAGVFSMDKVGDAVKEFNIRAKDGSDSTAEAFENLGMNADVMTARFAAGGEQASTAFFEVVNALNSMSDPVEKNTTAVALFGTQYEDLEASILPVLANIQGGTLDMYDALGKVSTEAKSMGDNWQQAGNSISAAFGTAVTPTLEKASNALAGFVQGIGEFLQEHPTLTKAITAIGIGLGVVVAGIAGVTFVTTVAIPAVTAFGAALNTALGPIGWVALAITGIVAAGTALVALMSDAEDETADMTATTRQQYYELQDLNAEYDEACEKYGETSEEALRLKYQVDDLSAAFEANRQTVEEFTAEVDALVESHNELISDYEESMTALNENEVGTLSLIQKLEDLASQTNRTAAEEEQLKAVIAQLNEDLPDLALAYDDVTSGTENWLEATKRAAEAQAEQERHAEQQQAYVDLLKEQANLEEEIAKAEENLRLSQESDANAAFLSDAWFYNNTGWLGTWATDTDEYKSALEDLQAAYDENQAAIAEIEGEWEAVAEAAEQAAESPATYEEAVSIAYENVRAKVEELCAAYDEAYQAALESFEGQFGLFDEAEADMEATVANAQAALDSQLAYWENYGANIETLKNTSAEDLGITQENYEALMAYAQSGSEEAAGLAASMASAIKNGNEEAVAELANTVGEVQAAQEQTAAAVADWQTDFTAQMDAIEQEMQTTIDGMNLSDEAAASASATITSYADKIRAGKSGAVAAAQEVANAVSAALSSANANINVSVNSSGVPGHARGTTSAESLFLAGEQGPELVARPAAAYASGTTDSTDYFIAGENGPELIVGEQGSTVFPTEETDRLINALNDKRRPLQVFSTPAEAGADKATEQVKRILLEIAGSGAIEVSGNGGADRAAILEILTEHLKPVLMKIIQSEIYEEGELSYEY
jgi:TP901 family phage tail tape measure protein